MYKHLFRTVFLIMLIMGSLLIGVANATDVTITYDLNGGYWVEDKSTESKNVTYTWNENNNTYETTERWRTPSRYDSDGKKWMFDGRYIDQSTTKKRVTVITGDMTLYAKRLEFNDQTFTYNGVEVTIMDRDLGNGDHFQWGNNYGFKPCYSAIDYCYYNIDCLDEWVGSRVCNTFPNKESLNNNAENITGYISTYYSNKWNSNSDSIIGSNLWGGENSSNPDSNKQGPCPEGYHVPDSQELNKWSNRQNVTYGFRINNCSSDDWYYGGDRCDYFSQGVYWAEVDPLYQGNYPKRSIYNSSNKGNMDPLDGYPIRCFKNTETKMLVFHSNGGDNISSMQTSRWWETSQNLPNLEKEDKIFGGRYTSYNFQENTRVTNNNINGDENSNEIQLYAKWTDKVTVTFETNGGSPIEPQIIAPGSKIQRPDNPTMSGYIFVGWYDNEELTGQVFDFQNTIIEQNITLYAMWREIEDIVTYNTGAGISYIDTNGKEFTGIGTITINGENPVIILDRDLGAEISGIGTQADGYQFQRGNNYGFKSCKENNCTSFPGGEVTTSTKVDASGYGWNNPYISSGFITSNDGIWDSSDSTLWNESDQSKRQGPCPAGYHIPNIDELNNLVKNRVASYTGNGGVINNSSISIDNGLWGIYGYGEDIRNDLLLSYAGRRTAQGKVEDKTDRNWSFLGSTSPIDNSQIHTFKVSDDGLGVTNIPYIIRTATRVDGVSIRCFKDTYAEGDEPYILSYETNGGTKIQSQTILSGEKGYLPGYTTHKTGMELVGWFNSEGTEKYEFESNNNTFSNLVMNSDIEIYAKWGYRVTFLDQSGNVVTGTVVEEGKKAIAPELQPQTGYEIVWYDEGGNLFDIEDEVITGDINLIAGEKAIIYTITFDTDGGNQIAPITGIYDSDIVKPSNPTKAGFTFKGWNREIPSKMPAEDITIKALWNKNGGGGGGGGGSSSSNTGSAGSQTGSKINSNTGDTVSSGINTQELKNTTGNQTPQNNISSGTNVNDFIGETQDSSANASEGQAYTQEFQQAYEFAKENGITTMLTIQKAQMNTPLTRIAMAKMLSQYAMNVLGQKPENIVVPKFNDVTEKMNSDYDDGVTLAYQLGIMGQNMPGNNFRPDDEVTRAEFATALSRMLYGTSDGEYKSTAKYYINHMKKLKEEGIITKDDPKMKELRGYVMIMLMRSAK